MAVNAKVLFQSNVTGEKVLVDLPLDDDLDQDRVCAELGLGPWVDIEDAHVRNAVAALWATRQKDARSQAVGRGRRRGGGALNVKVFGGVGFRLLCPSSNAGPLRRSLNDIDYVTERGAGPAFVEALSSLHARLGSRYLHYLTHDDTRFNAQQGGRRFRVQMVVSAAGGQDALAADVDVFAHELSFCHRIPIEDAMRAPGPSLPLGLLVLTKCQFIRAVPDARMTGEHSSRVLSPLKGGRVAIGMEPKDLVDVAAAFADHDIGSETLDPTTILEGTSRDWGLATTLMLNLRNRDWTEHVLRARGVDPETTARVVSGMERLADMIEERMPRRPRLRLREEWWEEVEDS